MIHVNAGVRPAADDLDGRYQYGMGPKMLWALLRDIGLMTFLLGYAGLVVSKILAGPLGPDDVKVLAVLGDGTMICGATLALIAMSTGYFIAAISP